MPYLVNAAVVLVVGLMFPLAEHIPPFGELVRWMDTLAYRMQAVRSASPPSSDVVVVAIDERALDGGAERLAPIDRAFVADLLTKVAESEPRVIAVDIDLREPLRSVFDAAPGLDITSALRSELEQSDERLTATVNALAGRGVPIVLASLPDAETSDRLPYDRDSDHLTFADARAYVEAIDRVLYSFPTRARDPVTPDPALPFTEAPRPSFSFAAWAMAHGATSVETRVGTAPVRFADSVRSDWKALRDGSDPLVNWRRLDPRPGAVALPTLSATEVIDSDEPLARLKAKVVVVGRTTFATAPFPERRDVQPTPYAGLSATGVTLQALFIDNLMTRSWARKASFFQALVASCLLSIGVGAAIIWAARQAKTALSLADLADRQPPLWAVIISDGYLAFILGTIGVVLVGLVVNGLFLQRGLYMLSITLLPLGAALEALLFTLWSLRS
ncbi:MAG: CHASE2 domain-containing protein [Pseudomonadota bacterium]